jgi:hypothetical protein
LKFHKVFQSSPSASGNALFPPPRVCSS